MTEANAVIGEKSVSLAFDSKNKATLSFLIGHAERLTGRLRDEMACIDMLFDTACRVNEKLRQIECELDSAQNLLRTLDAEEVK